MLVIRTKPELPPDAVQIRLTKSMYAYVSPCDEIRVGKLYWRAVRSSGNYYAHARKIVDGKTITIRMHRFIMNCPPWMKIHHIDHNTLNNCRENLEVISEIGHRHLDGWHYFEK
jgi:hypothetical protein